MIRKKLIALAIASVSALSTSAMAQSTVLRIQDYPGLGNFLVRVANANGLCAKHAITCELRSIPQAPLAMQTLLAGDLDVAFTPPEVLVQAVNKGAAVKAIGSGASGPTFFLMAGAGLDTPNAAKGYPAVMQDFKGKKIGVTARGSAAEFQLVSLLKGAGMSAQDVTIVAVGSPNTAFPAISQKQIDGLMLFTPMDGFCEVSKVCRVVVDPRKAQGPSDVLETKGASMLQVVRDEFLQKNSKAIEGYRRAMTEASEFAQNPANFAALLKIAQDTFKINVPNGDQILEVSLRNSLPTLQFPVDPKAFQEAARYMQRTGQISKVVDTSTLLVQ
ncbi:ABC transporter substrate-binding protein [Comamonas testosteroni]|uniref:ABC transporter substrate-binding protein n=1 Tax=Comamonas testosteroni TaxID=285 RepID=UPI0023AB3F05|nr:ABC transporter substrate-binding protein [Comamonas testosteroni]WEE79490.1 ABC transporter substrate-binding protein [Comamonas testosteroni]